MLYIIMEIVMEQQKEICYQPFMASASNPNGVVPGTSIGYEMTTSMIQFGISYTFNK